MEQSLLSGKNILVAGGTSGLGLEVVRQLAEKGCTVTATGRNPLPTSSVFRNVIFRYVDFRSLRQVSGLAKELVTYEKPFDIVINNAGILSPPFPEITTDGFESTFQVNFLSHLLLDLILISGKKDEKPLLFIPVTSPVYRMGKIDFQDFNCYRKYSRIKAYSGSKLYLVLMSRYLGEKYSERGICGFCFDPGVFSSGIYRTQKKWFHKLYHVGAPFLKNPSKVAQKLIGLAETGGCIPGAIYKRNGQFLVLPSSEPGSEKEFLEECTKRIVSFMQ